ncbi:MAG TPA: polyphosphate kinase [Aggregicoccus sp.]|nr:polyphosphate kinase [Aggregicoccus sp.]
MKSHTRAAPRQGPGIDVFPSGTLSLDTVDLEQRVESDGDYEAELEQLQYELYRLQIQQYLAKRRTLLVFEGWDASGKGGAIKRLTCGLDPRGFKVWPISAPNAQEAANHYLWRFWQRVPPAGELAIFDRSWYGRVMVERVERLVPKSAWSRAYDEINAFEHTLAADGVRIAKFFIHIDKRTQLKRFQARERDPVKQYKIGPEDWRNRSKWSAYAHAIQEMLDRTHRPEAPWHLVAGNDKKHARLDILRTCVRVLQA